MLGNSPFGRAAYERAGIAGRLKNFLIKMALVDLLDGAGAVCRGRRPKSGDPLSVAG
jgi:hypothetical protein